MWFNAKDIDLTNPVISLNDLRGYVLPHAGTEFTGKIIAHTLRFRPTKQFNKILILYYPASEMPDVDDVYFHEYYVPWKSLEMVFGDKNIEYIGYNVNLQKGNNLPDFTPNNTLIVLSADFSHFLPFHKALELENKAAHALMFRKVEQDLIAVDDMKTFRLLYNIIPPEWMMQWVGRTRSNGEKAVGYLSFLISETKKNKPDGIFVTAFSETMTPRECLGEWFDKKTWSYIVEKNLVNKVLRLGSTTSRLTDGTELDVPLSNYTITYLYKTKDTKFVRGWHGILHNAFFLPEVFLESTYENGTWINSNDTEWLENKNPVFDLTETLSKLNIKAGLSGGKYTRNTHVGRNKHVSRNLRNYKSQYKGRKRTYCKLKGGGKKFVLYTNKVVHYTI